MTTKHHRLLIQQGRCAKCGAEREPEQAAARHCLRCADYHRVYNKQVRAEEVSTFALPYAGHRPCRVCRRSFFTTDKRAMTCCPRCQNLQFLAANSFGCLEHRI